MAQDDIIDLFLRKPLISEDCVYYPELAQTLMKIYRIPAKHILVTAEKKNIWFRDYYFTDNNLDYHVSNPAFQTIYDSEDQEEIARRQSWFRTWRRDPRLYYRERPRDSFFDTRAHFNIASQKLGPLTTISQIDLEGGNIIQATNLHKKKKMIVGFNAVLNTAFLVSSTAAGRDKLHSLMPENPSEKYQIKAARYGDLSAYTAEAKKLVAEELKIDKTDLIVIPQWIYHIDCMLAYIAPGVFAIHSFEETLNQLDRLDIPPRFKRAIKLTAQKDKQNYETNIVNEVVRKLEKHGFIVIKCAGVIKFSYLDDNVYCTNFMNGVAAAAGPNDQRYYLTNASQLPLAEKYFEEHLNHELRKHNYLAPIKVHYLNVDPDRVIKEAGQEFLEYYIRFQDIVNETMSYMSKAAGGLRCQINLVSDTSSSYEDSQRFTRGKFGRNLPSTKPMYRPPSQTRTRPSSSFDKKLLLSN